MCSCLKNQESSILRTSLFELNNIRIKHRDSNKDHRVSQMGAFSIPDKHEIAIKGGRTD